MNIVLATYLTHQKDPQRRRFWKKDHKDLLPLINSVTSKGVEIKIFHDCFDNPPKIERCGWIRVPPNNDYLPTVSRWFEYLKYLKGLDQLPTAVFMVDSTDVEMLKNPFDEIEDGVLYCGCEQQNSTDNPYLRNKERYIKISDYKQEINKYNKETLLNAGICGGTSSIVIQFLTKLTEYHSQTSFKNPATSLDMPIFSYTARKHFTSALKYGDQVNTRFRKDERNNTSWWKHK